MNPSILIAMPCYDCTNHSYTTSALFSLGKLLDSKGILSDIVTISGESFLPTIRNKNANTFLHSEHTHMFSLDNDILFDPEAVLVLLEMNVNFAAGAYRLKKPEIEHCFATNTQSNTDDEIFEVAYVGAGFQLLRKELFLNLIKSGLVRQFKGIQGTEPIWDFYSPIVEDGLFLPEDISFCRRCSMVGEKIWINKRINLGHFGGAIYGSNDISISGLG